PLCSNSGATIHTSSVRVWAMPDSTWRPGAWMPSSLVIRIRWAASAMGGDPLQAAHVGSQRLRHDHRAVGLLVVLQHGDEGAAHRQPGAVQGVDKARLLARRRTVAGLHAPGLEVAKVRATGNLAKL